jgi:hypothetical protein
MGNLANLTTTFAMESAAFVNGAEVSRAALGRLTRQLDPAGTAQAKFNQQTRELKSALDAGAISLDKYSVMLSNAERRLETVIARQQTGVQSTGQMRSAMTNLSYQAQDTFTQLSMGANVFQVIAIQGGQAAGAFATVEGAAGSVARFMIGPWGLAITGAILLLGALTKDHKDAADATKKHSEAEDALKQAMDRLHNASATQHHDTRQGIQDDLDAAEAARKHELRVRGLLAAWLERAKFNLQQQREAERATGVVPAFGQPASQDFEGQIAAIEGAQKLNAAKIAQANADLAAGTAKLALRDVAAATDKATAATQQYEDAIDRLQRKFESGGFGDPRSSSAVAAFKAAAEAATRAKDATLAALDATKKAANDNRQTGRQISLPEAEAIVKSIGGTITSATRTFDQQAKLYRAYLNGTGSLAAKPGHSDHELGNALDIAKTPGMSLAKIRAAFTEAGVSIKQLLDEGNHFHVAWKAGADPAIQASKDEAAAIRLIGFAAKGTSDALADINKHFKQLNDNSNGFDDIAKGAATAFGSGQDIAIQNERDLQQVREGHIRQLGDIYYDLFDGGTRRIWQDFERIGMDIISRLLSEWTMNALMPTAAQRRAGQSGGIGNIFGAIGRLFGGGGPAVDIGAARAGADAALASIPHFANGGSFQFGGRGGIDKNILSLNGSPIAAVSRGETATIGNGRRAANDQPIVIHIVGEEGAAFVPRVAAISGITSSQSIQIAQKTQMKKATRRLGR